MLVAPSARDLATATQTSPDEEDDALPAVGKVWSAPTESLSSMMAKHRAASAPAVSASNDSAVSGSHGPPLSVSNGPATAPIVAPAPVADGNLEAVDAATLPALWQTMLGMLAHLGPMHHSLVSQGQLVGIDDGRIVLRYGPQHETFVRMWEKNGKKELIREAASKALNQTVGVKFEIEAGEDQTPAPQTRAPDARPQTPPAAKRPTPSAPAPPLAPEPAAASESPAVKVTNELVDSLMTLKPAHQVDCAAIGRASDQSGIATDH